jgi:small-conductance mechanosensitive channel
MAGELDIFGLKVQLPPPLDNEVGVFVATVAIVVLLALCVHYLLRPVVHAIAGRSPTRLDNRLLEAMDGSIFALIVLMGARTSMRVLEPIAGVERLALIEAGTDVLIVVVFAYAVYRVFREFIAHSLDAFQSKGRELVVPLLDRIGALFIGMLALAAIGSRLGIDLSALLVGGAFLGIVIGLAAQETLANLFAGISIILDRPFRVGDMLELSTGEVVQVEEIGLRSSRLYHPYDSSTIVLPNTLLATTKITNSGAMGDPTRMVVRFRLPYDAEPATVERLLLQAISHSDGVLDDDAHRPAVRLSNFLESAAVYEALVWVQRNDRQWEVASRIRSAGLPLLNAAGLRPNVIGTPQGAEPRA